MATSSSRQEKPPKKISDVIPFADIAQLMEDITNKAGTEKIKLIKRFLTEARKYYAKIHGGSLASDPENGNGDSIYCIIRILLPTEDRGRKAYGMKSTVLSGILVDVLGLKGTGDGQKLLKFKSPQKAGPGAGDFSALLFSILESRFSDNSSSEGRQKTLTDFHAMLDNLAENTGAGGKEYQKKILKQYFKAGTSPLEGKWLARILLKRMHHGVASNLIFNAIHPKAKELYERTGNLEKVCQKLNDPVAQVEIPELCMFDLCRPMLCTRMTVMDDGFEPHLSQEDVESTSEKKSNKTKAKNIASLPTPPFIVETKWDGERFQLHFDGKVLKYLSKKGFDFTDNFNQTLTPRLRPQILSGSRSFILDGEMMAWHKTKKIFTLKGGPIDVKKINLSNPNHCPVFVAFDVLLYDEEILLNKPLVHRSNILKQIIRPKEGAVLITQQHILHNKDQVMEALNDAIANLEEGLIVKDMNSVYSPGKRIETWLKIKPEYLDDTSVDDLDLLILGAYYTESVRKAGEISHFLVGIIDKSDSTEKFYAVARVGSGKLRNPEMKGLVDELSDVFTKTEFRNVIYKGHKRPDFFIDPKTAIVVQIKASEITFNDTHALKYTLRFPRITHIRRDKPYYDVMTVQEFHRLRESCGGKLAKRTDGKGFPFRKRKKASSSTSSDDDEPAFKKSSFSLHDSDNAEEFEPKPGPSRKTWSSAAGTSSTNVSPFKSSIASSTNIKPSPKKDLIKKSNIFNSKVFCVYGSTSWKSKMEADIKMHGGEIVQNPVKDKFWIIGENEKNLKVHKAIKSGNYDVLKPLWVIGSIENQNELNFTPDHFFRYTEVTGKQFRDKYDEFGDSYTTRLSLDETKSLISKITSMTNSDSDENDSEDSDLENIKQEVNEELFSTEEDWKIERFNFFKSYTIAFREEVDPVLAAQVEFYGGSVANEETDQAVTHVIVKNSLSPRKKGQIKAFIVKSKWIEDSVKKREAVHEFGYTV